MQLPFGDGVVDDDADVVHRAIRHDLAHARVGIDFDFGDMTTVRIRGAELAVGLDGDRLRFREVRKLHDAIRLIGLELTVRVGDLRGLDAHLERR